jgi:hypothetical protein
MAKLHEDWREFSRLLNAHHVKFVIDGAHAVAAHSEPRLTADLDIFIQPTRANATRVASAVAELGFGTVDVTRLTKPNQVFMGREPYRIDILSSIDGVTFRSAWANRARSEIYGIRVAFLGLHELLRNKRAAGRPKDLVDLELLKGARGRRTKKKK